MRRTFLGSIAKLIHRKNKTKKTFSINGKEIPVKRWGARTNKRNQKRTIDHANMKEDSYDKCLLGPDTTDHMLSFSGTSELNVVNSNA